jgi:hypothetical protein
MRKVSLAELLRRQRGSRSLREMARLTGLSVTSIKAQEDGATQLPALETLHLLGRAYDIEVESLALAAYGAYYEPDPLADAVPV